jgi:putative oxidoreductase
MFNLDRLGPEWPARMLSVMRIAVALIFLEDGTAKFLGVPHVARFDNLTMMSLGWFAGLIELVGGSLLVLGLFTRAAA